MLVGNAIPDGATPIAQAYAGHQFGGFSPRLGDGRARLVGEMIDVHGRRRDLHLKGSGRTPFARGGDGKAAVGPMLREFLISEALYSLGIPTTRSLAVVATGEAIRREAVVPGAVLARVASSHLRVGSFQFAANSDDPTLLQRVADYAIDRHYPAARAADNPYLALLQFVAEAQASLMAQWMLVGFIHGVMNTDNVTISGESIDFGPCAFMDAFDPATVFSSIDHSGRYAYGNQPTIGQWNMARFAETLLPLIHADTERSIELATEILVAFPAKYHEAWSQGMRAKLGLANGEQTDPTLIDDYLTMLINGQVDYTGSFRALAMHLRDDPNANLAMFGDDDGFHSWEQRWRAELDTHRLNATANTMDSINPIYIPRNHLVEAALADGQNGDLRRFETLRAILADPFTALDGVDEYAQPAGDAFGNNYRTFCGT